MTILPIMALGKKPTVKLGILGRYILTSFILVLFFMWSLSLLRTNSVSTYAIDSGGVVESTERNTVPFHVGLNLRLPKQNELSKSLDKRNLLPPRNMDCLGPILFCCM